MVNPAIFSVARCRISRASLALMLASPLTLAAAPSSAFRVILPVAAYRALSASPAVTLPSPLTSPSIRVIPAVSMAKGTLLSMA